MSDGIAIVGLACCYPGANTPDELWENVLAQRRAFRRIPAVRLRIEDHFSEDRSAPDTTYSQHAALIEGYVFDRVRYRVSGESFRATDLAHWLALDVASRALADAGWVDAQGLPKESTRVIVGNTLTGEFSRAATLRLRWPYVRRVLESTLSNGQWQTHDALELQELLGALETRYKEPFAPVGEETLAGGLSNTIAGRICNFFDFGGGGYTLDGACASSLLAVAEACSALTAGDIDIAIAGGVDLSMDPFELVGFAKVGALASGEMRVFDQHPTGFLPGEGCGFVVLMRHADAVQRQAKIQAVIRGWGISSDGKGGITRPDTEGQLLAVRRAYQRAGFGPETVSLFEGHGTGTAVGDATELEVLAQARRASTPKNSAAAIGSIKAIIGHTKAAAGVGGLIKSVKALQSRILPPATGCSTPHPLLKQADTPLRPLPVAEPWPAGQPLRAAISAMGFGGINCHVVLEGTEQNQTRTLTAHESKLAHSNQGAELFCFSAASDLGLTTQIRQISAYASRLSVSELTDLAATLAESCGHGQWRAAVVAASAEELQKRLVKLDAALTSGSQIFDVNDGIFTAPISKPPRITFLFPGQGSPVYLEGGILPLRYPSLQHLFGSACASNNGGPVTTDVAQPAIVRTEVAGLRLLQQVGIEASAALGHSLGELVALHWAGAFDEAALLRIADTRGKSMADCPEATGNNTKGAMAMIAADANDVSGLLESEPVVVAGMNSPLQTVISGEASAVTRVVKHAKEMGFRTGMLPVQHAFHSPLMAAAELPLHEQLRREQLHPVKKKLYSTVSGTEISEEDNIEQLLLAQLTGPVLFFSAMQKASHETDLFIEVGPGSVLAEITRSFLTTPVIAMDCGSGSLKGFLTAIAAAFAMGAPVEVHKLFVDRFTRKFSLDWTPTFFANPCESVPVSERTAGEAPKKLPAPPPAVEHTGDADVLTEIIQLVANRCELPIEAISTGSRLRDDLHLNSITVSQIIVEVARKLGIQTPPHPTDYSNVTLAEAAQALEAIQQSGNATQEFAPGLPTGVDSWTRAFHFKLSEEPLVQGKPLKPSGQWQVLAPDSHQGARRLQDELQEKRLGAGIVVWLPLRPDQASLPLLLRGAALSQSRLCPLIVLQHGWGASAFCRSYHLESPEVPVAILNIPAHQEQVAGLVLSEAAALSGFVEAHYDDQGRRLQATLCPLPLFEDNAPPALSIRDVLLVSGGGKGIGAECALQLARESGCKVVLLGRSNPELDLTLAENLRRFTANGIAFQYLSVDVADPGQVAEAIQRIESETGPITAVLHAAGVNQPCRLADLDEPKFSSTLAPKLGGAQNLISALHVEHLRFFIAFGSIIARTGLHGEAHYGLANEWLAALIEEFQGRQPHCRCMVLEWSVWSGTGMGESLGTIEALRAQGVTPIPVDAGTNILKHLLRMPPQETRIVVSSRFSQHSQLMKQPELPLRRFLEIPRVYYPGIELVVDSDISLASDPYLQDHVLKKEHLLPAVVSLEAMAQVASVLLDVSEPPVFEDVEFAQAISVPAQGKIRVRVAGLLTSEGIVELVIRTEATGFALDHVRATCKRRKEKTAHSSQEWFVGLTPVPLDCERDLYQQLLFHQGRFRCVNAYYKLAAKECLAELRRSSDGNWFARHLPAQWLLGRPDIRDAAIHAIQACIPHARVLPVGLKRIVTAATELPDHCYMHAREVSHQGASLIYDMEIVTAAGEVLEVWTGLKLQIVEALIPTSWSPGILGPYLERKMTELVPSSPMKIAFEQTSMETPLRTKRAAARTNGYHSDVYHRPYGRPDIQGNNCASFSHSVDLTMLVAGDQLVACDLESAAGVSCPWQDLLGPQHHALAKLVSGHSMEDFNVAATRIWSALECLKKAEAASSAPLSMLPIQEQGWVLLRSGTNLIATFSASVTGRTFPLVVAILAAEENQRTALAGSPVLSGKPVSACGD
jgi:enediyne polyketide synthase